MANIATLLARILTTRYGKDMRQDLHDSIEAVNNDVETCGQTVSVSGNQLSLKRGSTTLSTATLPTGVSSVNNKTGAVTLTASDVGAASSSDIKNGTLTIQKNGTTVQTFGANESTNKTANITVPTKVSDLTNDSGFSSVSVNQIKSSGEKIAEITVDGTKTDIYASAGGGGGGGDVTSVNGMQGDVVLDVGDINDVQISSLQSGQILKYNGSKWVNANESGGAKPNANLLANGWFKVNTTGKTSGTFPRLTTSIDRWYTTYSSNANNKWSWSSSGISFDTTVANSGQYWAQYINDDASLRGKQITASVKYSDNTIVSGTVTRNTTSVSTEQTIYSNDDFDLRINNSYFTFYIKANRQFTVRAVKLEIGSESTLSLDAEPTIGLTDIIADGDTSAITSNAVSKLGSNIYTLSLSSSGWHTIGKCTDTKSSSGIINVSNRGGSVRRQNAELFLQTTLLTKCSLKVLNVVNEESDIAFDKFRLVTENSMWYLQIYYKLGISQTFTIKVDNQNSASNWTIGNYDSEVSASAVDRSGDVLISDIVFGKKLDQSAAATVEDGSTSSKAYAIGEYFIRGGKYCKCISAIASGGTFTKNTNYQETDIGAQIKATNTALSGKQNALTFTSTPSSSNKVVCLNDMTTAINNAIGNAIGGSY